jgi:cation diffusion facilitator CzcD-associated flavoprotein CzcO
VSEHHRIIIIGAGFGGLSAAHYFLEDGVEDCIVIDQAPSPGGTWYYNRYPGAECDVMSHLYSFSWAINPRWSRRYAMQPEILAYVRDTVRDFGIEPKLRLSTTVKAMTWDEAAQHWHIATDRGDYTADFVVGAVGMFNEPSWPAIPGLVSFKGPVIHTARWPEGEDFAGRKVAVIGSAATAVQLVPELAETATHVFALQRTPVWVASKDDRPYAPEDIERFCNDPEELKALRAEIETRVNRTMTFKHQEILEKGAEDARRNIAAVRDDALRDRLTPTMPWSSRRPVMSNRYYPAFNRDDVELVTERIAAIEPEGVRLENGRLLEVDAIVCATGFAVSKFLSVLDVTGRDGRSLDQDWAEDPYAYLGVLMPGYPNLVTLYGPNTNNGSLITMLESAARFAVKQHRWMTEESIASFEIRSDVTKAFNEDLQKALDRIEVWRAKPDGYYRGRSGRIVTQWPHSMIDYENQLQAVTPDLFLTRQTVEISSP